MRHFKQGVLLTRREWRIFNGAIGLTYLLLIVGFVLLLASSNTAQGQTRRGMTTGEKIREVSSAVRGVRNVARQGGRGSVLDTVETGAREAEQAFRREEIRRRERQREEEQLAREEAQRVLEQQRAEAQRERERERQARQRPPATAATRPRRAGQTPPVTSPASERPATPQRSSGGFGRPRRVGDVKRPGVAVRQNKAPDGKGGSSQK